MTQNSKKQRAFSELLQLVFTKSKRYKHQRDKSKEVKLKNLEGKL